MKYKWLNKKTNSNIIIFFNGWGMDESVVSHLETADFDVLMFYDYNTLDTDFDFNALQSYNKRNIVAWSMGVMIATLFNIDNSTAVAVNGTLKPIDNTYGIPVKIYDLTESGLNEKGKDRFVRNMFDDSSCIPKINRTLENQKNELSELKKYSSNMDFKYNKIWISSNDKIIPTKNQCAFWNMEPNIHAGHCPFFKFKRWEELL